MGCRRPDSRRGRRGVVPLVVVLRVCALGVPVFGSSASADEASPPPLVGEPARDRVVGNTLDGTTPDGPYTLFVAADGRLVSADRDGRVDGTWQFRDGKFCTVLPDEDEECRALEVAGAGGAFVDGDGTRYPFMIRPGNPKGF